MTKTTAHVSFVRGGFELDVAMALQDNQVTALLGPSGSGKSTVLRLLAGLERPSDGWIVNRGALWFDAERRIDVPPQQRGVGMVFQDYALFNHLTVAENIGYGVHKRLRAARVAEWLERLHLTPYAGRYPQQLSGGQRQRVAVGRALATEPALLLLDEPFSAIDVSLRRRLRKELKEVIGRLSRPVLMVTHDLEEAQQLADHVCIMADGRILRAGSTREVFDNPCSRTAAEILGWQNFLPIDTAEPDAAYGAWGRLNITGPIPPEADWLGIRPEHVRFAQAGQEGLPATVLSVVEQGAVREIECRCMDGTTLTLHRPWDEPVPVSGTEVQLLLPAQYVRPLLEAPVFIDAAYGERVCGPLGGARRSFAAPAAT